MVDAPVDERLGSKAWPWLLIGAAAIALFAWWIGSGQAGGQGVRSDRDMADKSSIEELIGPEEDDPLVPGETISLERVRILSVAGESAFLIEYSGEPIPVLLRATQTPGEPMPAAPDFDEGMLVNLTGEVRAADDLLRKEGDLAAVDASPVYILGREVEPAG